MCHYLRMILGPELHHLGERFAAQRCGLMRTMPRHSCGRLDTEGAHGSTHAPSDACTHITRDLVRETEHTPPASRSIVALHIGFSSACVRAVGIMHSSPPRGGVLC